MLSDTSSSCLEKRCFHDLFAGLSKEEARKTALVCDGVQLSYAQLDQAIDRCTARLLDLGVKPGDRVGLWAYNNANAVVALFAIIRAGGVAVMGNYVATYTEIEHLFSMTNIRFLLHGRTHSINADGEGLSQLVRNLGVQGVLDINTLQLFFSEDAQNPHTEEIKRLCAQDDSRRDAFVVFTSGTTSVPKAVLSHQEGMMVNARRFLDAHGSLMGDAACVSLPHFHMFGLAMIIIYLMKRATVHLNAKPGATCAVETLKTFGCTDLSTVPAVFYDIIKHPDFDDVASNVRFLYAMGSFIAPAQFMKLEKAFPHAKLFNEYGQTETQCNITMFEASDPLEKRAFSVGKALHPQELAIMGSNNELLPDGTSGEIVVNNGLLFNGYDGLPPEEQGIDAHGWLHTGDLGYLDQDKYLHIVGRSKDMIIFRGENIAPDEVESAVLQLPGIAEAKVLGVPHEVWGESVECCVRLEQGAALDEDAYREQLKKTLSCYKIPKHFVPFESFPLGPTGKIDARSLRAQLIARIKEE